MANELKPDETGATGVCRIFRQQMSNALAFLREQKLTDLDLHAARKELKKARATLRLLRDALGDAVYRRENAALRDAARPLSVRRDGKVLLDTLGQLIERHGAVAGVIPLDGFLEALRRERRQTRRAMTPAAISRPRATLEQVHERSARWRVGERGWDVLGAGLKRIYRKGREAFAVARASRSTEDLHEWRKQVKYLWHELQVLEPLRPGLIGELADRAHTLADYLGDDHDLAVLREKVLQHADAFPDAAARWKLLALIDRRRTRLQRNALALGRRIYDDTPKAVEARFGRYWHDWREERKLADREVSG